MIFSYVCPSISRFQFHSYSGGGRANIISAGLRNGFNYTDKLLDIVYTCQMCGAAAYHAIMHGYGAPGTDQ
jgi:hypothetical protein